MSGGRSAGMLALAVGAATLLFWLLIHQVSGLWLDVALRPEVRAALEQSRDELKKLRTADAAHADQYRARFQTTTRLLQRLDVIRMNREQMLRRFEMALVAIFVVLASIVAAGVWRHDRRARALERRQYLDRLAVLQENARRHGHELKGPLTAARLELERAADALRDVDGAADATSSLRSAADELETLSRLSRQQASFAALGAPVLRRVSLGELVDEFCTTFTDAWPGLTLRRSGGDQTVCADRDLLRQVLVNLCSNSAAATSGAGSMTFALMRRGRIVALDATDTGSGIAESLRARIFDPYVTTRRSGEGMGLGLAISRKIMIDHGGDLQLLSTGPSGTVFRLTFGVSECN